ncbi:P1 family peptidase [Pseudobacter ginsenosidimutans]|uniref:L-aminopeptidase DmpA n=1 Tax=Pseudobacter ginsenosidimutans TaxID=661488 RepID=A0A4Q7MGM6_9BACT|nr:P1 family peptidase [Pseudobacter ginsenosidimutans]QEC45300.1 P1 family peptidase [Pseudobacter ginsenosidimutans]RZS65569.1 L-aminopeptidase DmpA [Pseudobacter ginsenosidimutans]
MRKIYSAAGLCCLLLNSIAAIAQPSSPLKRARDYGLINGILPTGQWNAITDVNGVKIGHTTVLKGDSIRTGVTVIMPHTGNIFQEKVPAAVFVGNGFGKSIGTTQIVELGNIETPIALTNTLNAPIVANAIIDYTLQQKGNEEVRSVNAVVGETNDGYLNDIRGRHVTATDVRKAIDSAASGPVAEGCIGAGTGTICMGFKGGIGTSSRKLGPQQGAYTVGVLVQTNFGGILTINGAPIGRELNNYYMQKTKRHEADGSCMIIIATDAPLSARNLERLARRSFLAFGKVGSFSSNGSGDYSIAFSTHPQLRIPFSKKDKSVREIPDLENDDMSPLFLAVVEATEEAIYNSLFMATDTKGYHGNTVKAMPVEKVVELLKKYGALNQDKLP